MTDITERTEALLTAMGWTRRLNGMWAVDVPKCQGDTVDPARPTLVWCFRHAVPWANEQGWLVKTYHQQEQRTRGGGVSVYHTIRGDLLGFYPRMWHADEPDRTAELMVMALSEALEATRD